MPRVINLAEIQISHHSSPCRNIGEGSSLRGRQIRSKFALSPLSRPLGPAESPQEGDPWAAAASAALEHPEQLALGEGYSIC